MGRGHPKTEARSRGKVRVHLLVGNDSMPLLIEGLDDYPKRTFAKNLLDLILG